MPPCGCRDVARENVVEYGAEVDRVALGCDFDAVMSIEAVSHDIE